LDFDQPILLVFLWVIENSEAYITSRKIFIERSPITRLVFIKDRMYHLHDLFGITVIKKVALNFV